MAFLVFPFVLYAGFFSFVADLAERFSEEPEQERFYRMLYLKLPLESIEYHWEFLDRKQLLEGELLLTFTSEGRKIKETIFSDGKLNANWEVISDSDAEDEKNNIIYFGFQSRSRYWFDKKDSARIVLTNAQILKGHGYDFKADLAAGKHEATAKKITQYADDLNDTQEEQDNAKAFISIEDWDNRWTLSNKTAQGTGWGASQ